MKQTGKELLLRAIRLVAGSEQEGGQSCGQLLPEPVNAIFTRQPAGNSSMVPHGSLSVKRTNTASSEVLYSKYPTLAVSVLFCLLRIVLDTCQGQSPCEVDRGKGTS